MFDFTKPIEDLIDQLESEITSLGRTTRKAIIGSALTPYASIEKHAQALAAAKTESAFQAVISDALRQNSYLQDNCIQDEGMDHIAKELTEPISNGENNEICLEINEALWSSFTSQARGMGLISNYSSPDSYLSWKELHAEYQTEMQDQLAEELKHSLEFELVKCLNQDFLWQANH